MSPILCSVFFHPGYPFASVTKREMRVVAARFSLINSGGLSFSRPFYVLRAKRALPLFPVTGRQFAPVFFDLCQKPGQSDAKQGQPGAISCPPTTNVERRI